MGADVSRVRFDALRDHSGVLMQQGRLLLDADWNELVDIVERRLRAGAADLGSTGPVAGIAGVAVVPRTTPDAFALTAPSAGTLSIGQGRMYVDGLLAENHGKTDGAFDTLLSEPTRNLITPYTEQPYWPTPAALPASGTHVAYLDVWKREVTPLEAPDLVEAAVGVDTTTRTQTVWQVRVHTPDTPGVACDSKDADIPGWSDLIAPSAGRLSTGTVVVTASDDPCSLPPSGNYRGLENQTYRVEIHTPGPAGTATFKWSRDNGSVAVAVSEIVSTSRLRPASLGKDRSLGLRTNDWVEILDDHRELNQQPGDLRRITVNADGTISFTPALTADLVPASGETVDRHLRVRRWDQAGQIKTGAGANVVDLDAATATGDIPVPAAATAIVLENGITAMLEAPGGRFRVGDHWIFAARTQTTSVEALVKAPPRGIHHHYARLGVLTGPAPSSDCRVMWPPDGEDSACGDCTVCVTPQSHASGVLTIQAAVDQVRPTGGTVCLAVGLYHLDKSPVKLEGCTSVRLRGQGPRTILLAANGGLEITRSAFVTVEDLTLVASALDGGVALTTTTEVTLRRLVILLTSGTNLPSPAIALNGVAVRTHVLDNDVIAPVCIGSNVDKDGSLTAGLEVAGNVLVGQTAGVQLNGPSAHLLDNVVRENTVLRCGQVGLQLLGVMPPDASFVLRDNYVAVQGTAIDIGNAGFCVRDNTVVGDKASADQPGAGISVSAAELGDIRGATTVSGNSVARVTGDGIGVRAGVTVLVADRNTIEGAGSGIVMAEAGTAEQVHVTHNVVRDVGGRDVHDAVPANGIQVFGAEHALVEGNTVVGVGAAGSAGPFAAGIRVVGCQESRVHGNSVEQVGFLGIPSPIAGIQVTGVGFRTSVEGNDARRVMTGVTDADPLIWTGIEVSDEGEYLKPRGFIALGGERRWVIGVAKVVRLRGSDYRAVVTGNTSTGGGRAPALVVSLANADVVLTGNQAVQRQDAKQPAVELSAKSCAVNGNRALFGIPSMNLFAAFAVVGNVTTNGIGTSAGPLGAPWAALNLDGVG
jgi:hypothetical protein